MDNHILSLEKIENLPIKVKLRPTVPSVAALLNKGYTITNIARAHNISPQAIDQYIDKHIEEISELIYYDSVMVNLLKYNNLKIEKSINKKDIDKAGLVGKRTAIGIGTDQCIKMSGNLVQEGNVSVLISIHQSLFPKQVGDNPANIIDVTPNNDDDNPPQP